jgi:hypothetical protein
MIDKNQSKSNINSLNISPSDLIESDYLLATLNAQDAISNLKTALTIQRRTVLNTLDLLYPLFVPGAVASLKLNGIETTNKSVYYAQILDEKEISEEDKAALDIINKIYEAAKKLNAKKSLNLKEFETYFNEAPQLHEVFSRMAILLYRLNEDEKIARILMPLYLMKHQKLPLPILFLSKYFVENNEEYNKRFKEVSSKGKTKEWIIFVTNAITEQAKYTTKILEKLGKAVDEITHTLKNGLPYMYTSGLVDYLCSHPYFSQKEFEEAIELSPMTARKYLDQMEQSKIISKEKQEGKNKFIYKTIKYADILKKA